MNHCILCTFYIFSTPTNRKWSLLINISPQLVSQACLEWVFSDCNITAPGIEFRDGCRKNWFSRKQNMSNFYIFYMLLVYDGTWGTRKIRGPHAAVFVLLAIMYVHTMYYKCTRLTIGVSPLVVKDGRQCLGNLKITTHFFRIFLSGLKYWRVLVVILKPFCMYFSIINPFIA